MLNPQDASGLYTSLPTVDLVESASALKATLQAVCGDRFSAGAVVSRNGIPVVWELPGANVETFATLSATIMGAADVVLGALQGGPTEVIRIDGSSGALFVAPIDKRSLLVLYGATDIAPADVTAALVRFQEADE